MSEETLNALRVIDGAAGQVSADRNPDHRWRRIASIRPPAQQTELVAQLMHGGPDVVEELYLHHRLESARSHPHRPADDVRFSQTAVVDAVGTELPLQPSSELEDTALALHQAVTQLL